MHDRTVTAEAAAGRARWEGGAIPCDDGGLGLLVPHHLGRRPGSTKRKTGKLRAMAAACFSPNPTAYILAQALAADAPASVGMVCAFLRVDLEEEAHEVQQLFFHCGGAVVGAVSKGEADGKGCAGGGAAVRTGIADGSFAAHKLVDDPGKATPPPSPATGWRRIGSRVRLAGGNGRQQARRPASSDMSMRWGTLRSS